MYEVILLTWMRDSGSARTVHRNLGGLNKDDSYLGRLAEGVGGWGYYLRAADCPPGSSPVRDDPTFHPCGSVARAERALTDAAEKMLPPEDSALK